MKKITFLLLSSLFTVSFSQSTGDKLPVKLKSGTQFYANNVAKFVSDNQSETSIQGRYYKFVQFNQIPNQSAKESMISAGLKFQEYIPSNTYLVSFPVSFDKKKLIGWNIKSVVNIENSDRITNLALSSPYPDWALEGNNVVLYISFYEDLNFSTCMRKIEAKVESVKSKNEHANKTLVVIDKDKVNDLLNMKEIRLVDLTPEPGKPEHELSRNMHRSTLVNSFYKGARKYDGEGIVVAVNDDGIVGPHVDFKGRMIQPGVTLDRGTHGDMVAGIIGGSGNVDETMAGMATGCDLIIRQYSSSLPNTVNVHINDSCVLFNSSYSNGCNAGYTSLARTVDREIRQNPTLMQVFSGGNSNNNNCGYGAGTQWGNITGGHKQGKNVMTVANLESNMSLATSSSRGPADDGRIKPDIAAHGNGNFSTAPNNGYLRGSGTSAAAPSIAGVMAQMYHAYEENNAGVRPESGLMKAIIMNTAVDFGNVGPDFLYGWGRVNAYKAILAIENGSYLSSTITTGNTNNHNIVVPAGVAEVKVMVYWHDYEASTAATTALVNDLDIEMSLGSSTFQPWILDPTPNTTNLNTPAIKGVDTLNNVEQVSIVNPAAGTYTLEVAGTSVPQGPQKYFVSYEFIYDEVKLANPNGGEGYVPGTTERIFWDAYGNSGNFVLSYSIDSGATWTTIGTSGATARFRDWAIPNAVTGKALLRIVRGTQVDISDNTWSIIGRPTNLDIDTICPKFITLSWDPVPGANEYQVFLLGNKFMDSVATTTNTYYKMPVTSPKDDFWYSVAAVVDNNVGNRGRRAFAEYFPGSNQLLNCQIPNNVGVVKITSPSTSSCVNGITTISMELENFGTNNVSNIPVRYQINGGAISNGAITSSVSAAATFNYSFPTSYNFAAPGVYTIKVWSALAGDAWLFDDTLEFDYNYAPIQTIPYSENFNSFNNCATSSDCEANVCNLRNGYVNQLNNEEDDIDWRVNTGNTPSNGTGPSGDHTSGFAKYLYIEASGDCYQKEASLITPCIDLGTTIANPYLNFWYHMNGGNAMGSLEVDIYDGTTWQNNAFSISGSQGNQWLMGSIDLTAYSGNIIRARFRGETGNFWDTDIAIDDINVSDHTSLTEDELSNGVSIYPNPNNGEFNLNIENPKIGEVNVSVFDMYGRVVYNSQLQNKNNLIQLGEVASGVYTVRITGKDQTSIKKIVIQ